MKKKPRFVTTSSKQPFYSKKSFLTIQVFLILGLFGIILFNESQTYVMTKNRLNYELLSDIETASITVTNRLDDLFHSLECVSPLLSEENGYTEQQSLSAMKSLADTCGFSEIYKIDKSGNGISHTGQTKSELLNYSYIYQAFKGQNTIFCGSGMLSEDTDKMYISMSVPIKNRSGSVTDVLTGYFSTDFFNPALGEISNSMKHICKALFIATMDGRVLSTSSDIVSGNIFQLISESASEKQDKSIYLNDLASIMLNGEEGFFNGKLHGEKISIYAKQVTLLNQYWYLLTMVNTDYHNDKFHNVILNTICVIIIAIILVSLIIVAFFLQQRLIIKLDKASKAKNDFLAHISHDIRTPLNAITGITDLALEEVNPSTKQDYLKKVNESSKYLLNIVNDTLDMSRIEHFNLKLNPEPVCFEDIDRMIHSVIAPQAAAKHIKLIVAQENLQPYVILDKLRVEQILVNLLSNSIKFTPEGGTITFKTSLISQTENTITFCFTIADTGYGMTETFMKKMFQPFEQEQNRISLEHTGTGLGLTIVKALVEMMNGSITCKSKKNEGTEFTVLLSCPVATQEQIEKRLKSQLPEDDKIFAGKTILVTEDNAMNMLVTRTLLENKKMNVECATNGKEAFDMFIISSARHYDAIIMDIHMPIMNGTDATIAIRKSAHPDAKRIPIIALSANTYDDDIQKCIESGMDYHIAKPIETDNFFNTLKKVFVDAQAKR